MSERWQPQDYVAYVAGLQGITIDELLDEADMWGRELVPCDCDYEGCKGWQWKRTRPPRSARERADQ